MKKWKDLSNEQQGLLMFSGEFLLFAVIFLVLGILKATYIIPYNEKRRIIFNYITLAGGAWGVVDFFWTLLSKKKREKNCMLDKVFTLILGIYIITVDIIALCMPNLSQDFYVQTFAAAVIYGGLMFVYMGIYHYFKPLPSFLEEIKKLEEEAAQEEAEKEAKEKEKEESKDN